MVVACTLASLKILTSNDPTEFQWLNTGLGMALDALSSGNDGSGTLMYDLRISILEVWFKRNKKWESYKQAKLYKILHALMVFWRWRLKLKQGHIHYVYASFHGNPYAQARNPNHPNVVLSSFLLEKELSKWSGYIVFSKASSCPVGDAI